MCLAFRSLMCTDFNCNCLVRYETIVFKLSITLMIETAGCPEIIVSVLRTVYHLVSDCHILNLKW
jgi:hypothetical protein